MSPLFRKSIMGFWSVSSFYGKIGNAWILSTWKKGVWSQGNFFSDMTWFQIVINSILLTKVSIGFGFRLNSIAAPYDTARFDVWFKLSFHVFVSENSLSDHVYCSLVVHKQICILKSIYYNVIETNNFFLHLSLNLTTCYVL